MPGHRCLADDRLGHYRLLRTDLVGIPEWARDLPPLNWMGSVPSEAWRRPAALTMTLIALVFAVFSTILYRRRDLRAG
jgi:ABC-2 type transport system permease protein